MDTQCNSFPNIDFYQENGNPIISSPTSEIYIAMNQTRETLMDTDLYRQFLKNIEMRVRKSVTYKNYKSFLMELGFDHCQVHGYINSEMASIEMHHNILTLFDIAMLITEHMLNSTGYVNTFKVCKAIKEEHKAHNVALVMLSKTPHQVYHDSKVFLIHPDMCIGNWPNLIYKYHMGLTQDLAFNILYYIKRALESGCTDDKGMLDLREYITDWSEKNA